METSEIDDVNGLPRDTRSLANELQKVLHDIGKRSTGNVIKHKSAQRYTHRVIEQVNKQEGQTERQKRKTKPVMIKVSGLIQKRENQSDPRLACMTFKNIHIMYRDIKKK